MDLVFKAELLHGKEGDCPHCGRYFKAYKRKLHVSVALQLIQLYKLTQNEEYVHASKLIVKGVSGVGDFTKAKYWHLIEEKLHAAGDKKSSGFWKLTDAGRAFIKKEIPISKYALVYDDVVLKYDGDPVLITQCLNEKFNYQQLMQREKI